MSYDDDVNEFLDFLIWLMSVGIVVAMAVSFLGVIVALLLVLGIL